MKSPFKFLDAYTLADQPVFFGRKKEVAALYQLLFESPIVLVYGMSGTGKTSLIKCGLASRFSGADWKPIYIRRNENINQSLDQALKAADPHYTNQKISLVEHIKQLYLSCFRPIYLIFDQFEELFILGNEAEQKELIQSLKLLLASSTHCKIIISVREEYLGHFYHFEKAIPYLFDFKMRIEKMNRETVKTVIKNSFKVFNISVETPEALQYERIIENVSQKKSGIVLPYLQVYLDRLYKEDYARTYPGREQQVGEYPPLIFTFTEIEEFGAIDNVLEQFLIEQERCITNELARKYSDISLTKVQEIVNHFITEEGTKKPIHYKKEGEKLELEADFKEDFHSFSDAKLWDCLEALEKGRIIRFTNETMELAHDTLAKVIYKIRDHEDLKIKEIKNQLRLHFDTYKETGAFLEEEKIIFYENFLPFLSLPDEINNFVSDSKKAAGRKKRMTIFRTMGWFFLGISLLYGVFVYNTLVAGGQEKEAEWQAQQSGFLQKISNLFNLNKKVTNSFQTSKTDRTEAYLSTREVLKDSLSKGLEGMQELRNELYQNIARYPFYKNVIPVTKNVQKAVIVPYGDSLFYQFTLSKNKHSVEGKLLNAEFQLLQDSFLFIHTSEVADFQLIQKDSHLQLISATIAGQVQIWSVKNRCIENHKATLSSTITGLALSTNQQYLLAATSEGLYRYYIQEDKSKGQLIWPNQLGFNWVKSNPSNDLLAVGNTQEHKMDLLNFTPKGNVFRINELKLGDAKITDLAFAPNGQYIGISYDDGTAGIWKASIGKELTRLTRQTAIIQSINFSPDSRFVLTGGGDNKAILWNREGEINKILIGHNGPLQSVAFIKKGWVSTSGEEAKLKIWYVGSLAEKSYSLEDKVHRVAFAPNGKEVIAASIGQLGYFNRIDRQTDSIYRHYQRIQQNENQGFIQTLNYIDSNLIIMAASNHLTTILEKNTGHQTDFRNGGNLPSTPNISCIAQKGNLIAIGDNKKQTILLRKRNQPNWFKVLPYTANVFTLQFDPKGPYLYAGYQDGNVQKWDYEQGLILEKIIAHTEKITDFKIAQLDSTTILLTASTDNTAKVWFKGPSGSFKFHQILSGHLQDITAIDFTPKANRILTASKDKTLKLWTWNGVSFSERKSYNFIQHTEGINTAIFSADGQLIATGGDDATVKIWNLKSVDKLIAKRTFEGK